MKRSLGKIDINDVPEHQRWMLKEPHKSRIERGLAWAATTETRATNVTELLKRVRKR
jgi:hypothetical protein